MKFLSLRFRCIRSLILVSLLMLMSAGAFAAPGKISDAAYFKAVLEHVHSRAQLIKVLEISDVSKESVKFIESDLKKRMPDGVKLPKIKVIKDQISLNGKKIPIYFVSYNPLTIRVNSEKWKYKEEKTGEDNYFTLIKILEHSVSPTASFSPLNLLLPQAHATTTPSVGFGSVVVRGMIGLVAGLGIAKATGNDSKKAMVLAALGGMFVGSGSTLVFPPGGRAGATGSNTTAAPLTDDVMAVPDDGLGGDVDDAAQ
jgi:hypothetical protein